MEERFGNPHELSPITIPDDYIRALMPAGWSYDRSVFDGDSHIYMTSSKIDPEGYYKTGLHIYVKKNFEPHEESLEEYVKGSLDEYNDLYPVDSPQFTRDYPLVFNQRIFSHSKEENTNYNKSGTISSLTLKPSRFVIIKLAGNLETNTVYFVEYITPWRANNNKDLGKKLVSAIEFSRFV